MFWVRLACASFRDLCQQGVHYKAQTKIRLSAKLDQFFPNGRKQQISNALRRSCEGGRPKFMWGALAWSLSPVPNGCEC